MDPFSGAFKVVKEVLVDKGPPFINFAKSEEEKVNDINEDNWSIASSQIASELTDMNAVMNLRKIAHLLKEKDFIKADITEETLKAAEIGIEVSDIPVVVKVIQNTLKRKPSEIKLKKSIKEDKGAHKASQKLKASPKKK